MGDLTATEVLDELRAKHIAVEADGDRLRVRGPEHALTRQLHQLLSSKKNELLEALRAPGESRRRCGEGSAPLRNSDIAPADCCTELPVADPDEYWVQQAGAVAVLDAAGAKIVELNGQAGIAFPGGVKNPMLTEAARLAYGDVNIYDLNARAVREALQPRRGGISWAEWKSEMLNALFAELGTAKSGKPITVDVVRDGEEKDRKRVERGKRTAR